MVLMEVRTNAENTSGQLQTDRLAISTDKITSVLEANGRVSAGWSKK